MVDKFKIEKSTIEELLFSKNKYYSIPINQRHYVWTKKDILDFLENVLDENSINFIGTIILLKKSNETKFEIIDGQQRLLSINIILSVLRHIAKSDNKNIELVEEINKYLYNENKMEYVESDDLITKDYEKYIIFNNEKMDFKEINKEIIYYEPEKKHIIANFHEVYNKLSNPKISNQKIKLIINNIKKLIVSLIIVNEEFLAYEIFENVNSKGTELSKGDLIKNYLIKKIRSNNKEYNLTKFKNDWKSIENNIFSKSTTNTSITQFLRYYIIGSNNPNLSENELLKYVQKKDSDELKSFLNKLVKNSEYYNIIINPENSIYLHAIPEKNNEVLKRSLKGLNEIKLRVFDIVLLNLIRNYKEISKNNPKIISLTISNLEKLAFQLKISNRVEVNKLVSIFVSFTTKIEKNLNNFEKIKEIFKKFSLDLIKIEQENNNYFLEKLQTLSYSKSTSKNNLLKYIFRKMDYDIYSEKINEDNDQIQLEHILPQKPEKYWYLTEKEIKNYVNLLGNLILLKNKLNIKVKNKREEKILDIKKYSHLKSNNILITEIIIGMKKDKSYWNENRINKRHNELIKQITEIWKLEKIN